RVLRTGMGPQAARAALAGALREEPGHGATAVLATGFCAGLAPGMHPGDLVVATDTRDGDRRTACTGSEVLAEALAGFGTVHTGTLAGSGHVVRGAERAALRESTGAVAVDMESAATLGAAVAAAGERPVAAVRVVVDAPGHELIRIGTLRGGISAFIMLRRVMPAFVEWHRSLLLPWR
ncbi:1-hydroxy-2-methyl-2-butenyl 4-diphosphate reductase, partial [Streptomyces sp. HNM0574]|uniref:phosphorylase family protein n=1 Tax=Streptomyces sp. HNM0574 TaxID=2714954 RepID=UPI00146F490E